jgi:hypothetical protein
MHATYRHMSHIISSTTRQVTLAYRCLHDDVASGCISIFIYHHAVGTTACSVKGAKPHSSKLQPPSGEVFAVRVRALHFQAQGGGWGGGGLALNI